MDVGPLLLLMHINGPINFNTIGKVICFADLILLILIEDKNIDSLYDLANEYINSVKARLNK